MPPALLLTLSALLAAPGVAMAQASTDPSAPTDPNPGEGDGDDDGEVPVQAKFVKKFKGKTKFDRKMNEEFSAVFPPGSDTAGSTVALQVEVLGDDGTVPPASGGAISTRVRYVGTADLTQGPVVVTLAHDGVVEEFAVPGEALGEGGREVLRGSGGMFVVVVRRRSDDSSLRFVVTNDDGAWDPSRLESLSVSDGLGDVPLDGGSIRVKYSVPFDSSSLPPVGADEGVLLVVETSLLDGAGEPLDEQINTAYLGDDAGDTWIEKVRVAETNRGDAKAIVWTRGDAGVPEVSLLDASRTELLAGASANLLGTELAFEYDTLTFEDPDSVAGGVVSMLVEQLDASGGFLEPLEVAMVMPEPGERAEVIDTTGASPLFVAIEQLDASNFRLSVATLSPEVVRVDVAFADDGSGPAAIPSVLSMEVAATFQKWSLKGSAGMGSVATEGGSLVTTLPSSDGAVQDVAGGATGDVPGVQYSFGKGTRESSSQASAKPELL